MSDWPWWEWVLVFGPVALVIRGIDHIEALLASINSSLRAERAARELGSGVGDVMSELAEIKHTLEDIAGDAGRLRYHFAPIDAELHLGPRWGRAPRDLSPTTEDPV